MRRCAFWRTHFHAFHSTVLRLRLRMGVSTSFGAARHLHLWVCVLRFLCEGTASMKQYNEGCCRDSFHRLFSSHRVPHVMHVHGGPLFGLAALHTTHDFFVLIGRKHTQKRHHALREATPSWRKAVVLWFFNHFVHCHHRSLHVGVLRKAGNRIRVRRDVAALLLHGFHTGHIRLLFDSLFCERTVAGRSIVRRARGEA